MSSGMEGRGQWLRIDQVLAGPLYILTTSGWRMQNPRKIKKTTTASEQIPVVDTYTDE